MVSLSPDRLMDGKNERKVQYEGKLSGAELQISTRRRRRTIRRKMVAVRRRLAKAPCPHAIPFPLCTRSPTTAWRELHDGLEQLEQVASRVDDPTVRSIADAMASNGMKDAGYSLYQHR